MTSENIYLCMRVKRGIDWNDHWCGPTSKCDHGDDIPHDLEGTVMGFRRANGWDETSPRDFNWRESYYTAADRSESRDYRSGRYWRYQGHAMVKWDAPGHEEPGAVAYEHIYRIGIKYEGQSASEAKYHLKVAPPRTIEIPETPEIKELSDGNYELIKYNFESRWAAGYKKEGHLISDARPYSNLSNVWSNAKFTYKKGPQTITYNKKIGTGSEKDTLKVQLKAYKPLTSDKTPNAEYRAEVTIIGSTTQIWWFKAHLPQEDAVVSADHLIDNITLGMRVKPGNNWIEERHGPKPSNLEGTVIGFRKEDGSLHPTGFDWNLSSTTGRNGPETELINDEAKWGYQGFAMV